jgi:hypothetical protein
MAGPEDLRDLLADLAALPGIGEELDYLGQLLLDMDSGPDAEASQDMLQARVHDQLDRICELLGRDST